MTRGKHCSWGRVCATAQEIRSIYWPGQLAAACKDSERMLARGYGRSYGDSCLLGDGTVLDLTRLDRFLHFDTESGILRIEGGVSLAQILEVIVPRGWFLPVTPGTKHVSVGGAIANDVHGKNHHVRGSFGCHVTALLLHRKEQGAVQCSTQENTELFNATIGGLGLTGTILWAELKLMRIPGPAIRQHAITFRGISEFLQISGELDRNTEYTVAWLDALSDEQRGIFFLGDHEGETAPSGQLRAKRRTVTVPVDLPGFVLNRYTVRAFNAAYYRANSRQGDRLVGYDSFFYPLDSVANWNRIYGRKGFFQYQCVVPSAEAEDVLSEILKSAARSHASSFLSVIKVFGDRSSPGLLSFPRPGVTLALDFQNRGRETREMLDLFDQWVVAAGGAVYPAKDARMSAASFQQYFPRWKAFKQWIDPHYTSDFWERVSMAG
ncbi:MAG TPA: FAD-binding oxidoreductase [Gammaproteobacteria bacterium]|nr:FAD-binding oxidoreductase [Gammaproteobacteria bacterium]